MRFSVVVPTRDRPEMLDRCLAGVTAALRPGDELVVADSASHDAAAVRAVAERHGARVVRVEEPGAARARNAGWQAATGEWVAFTDDDCVPSPGWLAGFAAALRPEGDASFLWGPVTTDRSGTGGVPELSPGAPVIARAGVDAGLLGASANLAVGRTALAEVGGFDVLLGAGAPLRASEDKDLQLRLLLAGVTGRLATEAVVQHDAWRDRRAALQLQHSYAVGMGALGVKARALGYPFPDGLLRTHVAQLADAVRHGYVTGVLGALLRLAGVVRGRIAVRGLSVVDGHLTASTPSRAGRLPSPPPS